MQDQTLSEFSQKNREEHFGLNLPTPNSVGGLPISPTNPANATLCASFFGAIDTEEDVQQALVSVTSKDNYMGLDNQSIRTEVRSGNVYIYRTKRQGRIQTDTYPWNQGYSDGNRFFVSTSSIPDCFLQKKTRLYSMDRVEYLLVSYWDPRDPTFLQTPTRRHKTHYECVKIDAARKRAMPVHKYPPLMALELEMCRQGIFLQLELRDQIRLYAFIDDAYKCLTPGESSEVFEFLFIIGCLTKTSGLESRLLLLHWMSSVDAIRVLDQIRNALKAAVSIEVFTIGIGALLVFESQRQFLLPIARNDSEDSDQRRSPLGQLHKFLNGNGHTFPVEPFAQSICALQNALGRNGVDLYNMLDGIFENTSMPEPNTDGAIHQYLLTMAYQKITHEDRISCMVSHMWFTGQEVNASASQYVDTHYSQCRHVNSPTSKSILSPDPQGDTRIPMERSVTPVIDAARITTEALMAERSSHGPIRVLDSNGTPSPNTISGSIDPPVSAVFSKDGSDLRDPDQRAWTSSLQDNVMSG